MVFTDYHFERDGSANCREAVWHTPKPSEEKRTYGVSTSLALRWMYVGCKVYFEIGFEAKRYKDCLETLDRPSTQKRR